MPTVSVIIPCYNQGQFVDEAVNSVLAQSYQDFEIIVVNDGSTDDSTTSMLAGYLKPKTRVITTENKGLAGARNTGIAEAKGRYILPLDADDLIEPHYMEAAITVFAQNRQVGIVYGGASLFGAVETEWGLPDFSIERMLIDNIIYCSAFFRKEDWEIIGGYDTGMIYGWEDYEFWLSIIELDREVIKLPENYFRYRVASDSMVRSKEKWQKEAMFKRIYLRHQALFSKNIDVWIKELLEARDVYHSSRVYVDCGAGISDQSSVMRKIEQGTMSISFDLNRYENITALRFDPVDTYCVLEIRKVSLKYMAGEIVRINDIESNALYQQDGLLLFDSQDPQVFFPELSANILKGISELTVELQFHALGGHALESIVAYQKEIIDTDMTLRSKLKRGTRSFLTSLVYPIK